MFWLFCLTFHHNFPVYYFLFLNIPPDPNHALQKQTYIKSTQFVCIDMNTVISPNTVTPRQARINFVFVSRTQKDHIKVTQGSIPARLTCSELINAELVKLCKNLQRTQSCTCQYLGQYRTDCPLRSQLTWPYSCHTSESLGILRSRKY